MAFQCYPVLPQREMTIAQFKAWLKQFDSNHDGKISREELENALRSLHTWFAWWKARQALKEADKNWNGVVDKDELCRLIDYAQQHLHMTINKMD